MVKTVAKRKNHKAYSAGIKEEEKEVGSRSNAVTGSTFLPAALTEPLLQEVKAE